MGESGLGHANKLKQFTLVPNESITRLYPSSIHSLYNDDTLQNIWSAGANLQRQRCISNETFSIHLTPIDYFKIHDLKKICASPPGNTTFFITENNIAYGCGWNQADHLGLIDSIEQ